MKTTAKKTRVRSEVVAAILKTLKPKQWTTREALVAKVEHLIPEKKALETYRKRIALNEPKEVKLKRGRAHHVMLVCITLVQHEKIEQEGRGQTKRYRLAQTA